MNTYIPFPFGFSFHSGHHRALTRVPCAVHYVEPNIDHYPSPSEKKRQEWERFLTWTAAAAAAKSRQSCPTLCDPIDGSPPGSPVPGILQARTQEWVAISFSDA